MNKERMISLIGELSQARGAPGFEDEVLTVIRRYSKGLGDLREDPMRNLYVYPKGNKGNPVVQLDAHTDEVAFMVQQIRADGTLTFIPLGGWVPSSVPAHAVQVRTANGYIPGILASKPLHFMTEGERNAPPKLTDMVIDVGAVSREDAIRHFGVRIGEPVVPEAPFQYIQDHDLLYGKAFDCRIGCAAMLGVLQELAGQDLGVDLVGAFAAQEEMGLRGARVTAHRVNPDAAIVFEGCPADDTFNAADMAQTRLKKGPMLRHIDTGMITNPRFLRFALELGEALGIPIQQAVRSGGSTNGGAIQLSRQGVPVIVIGLPVRYIHTPYGFASYGDFEQAVQLSIALIEALHRETIAAF